MSRIAIVGGHGQVARRLVPLLVARGDTPLSLVRNPDHVGPLEANGAEVGLVDLEADGVERLAELFTGADAVVFAAGGGPDGNAARKRTVDLGGSLASIEAAHAAGVRRFVQVSAIGVDRPLGDVEGVWRAYVEAKRDADVALRESGLDWTILRPGGLTDHPGTGRVLLGDEVDRAEVTRDDVAAVVAAVLADDRTIGHQWELVNGEAPIGAALDAVLGS